MSLIELRYRLRRRKEKFVIWLAYRLPRSLSYWSAMRLFSHATVGKYGNTMVTELRVIEALKRWELKENR